MVWDPRCADAGPGRRRSLVQTIDFAPTLMDLFGIDRTVDMEGQPLANAIATDAPVRRAGLFGSFGGHVNITDGRYVYMRAAQAPDNSPLFEYTLMPARMDAMMGDELRHATLAEPFEFSKGMPLLRVPGVPQASTQRFGSMLFDLSNDPGQQHPICDDEVELEMIRLMVELMRANDAPVEQFERLGLPAIGAPTTAHLVLAADRAQVIAALSPLPSRDSLRALSPDIDVPFSVLLKRPETSAVIERMFPGLSTSDVVQAAADMSLFEVATMLPNDINGNDLRDLLRELARIDPA
jgi:hypothetical protein